MAWCNRGREDEKRSFVLMQRFLFDVKVMELDGSPKGRPSHHAHVARRGDTRPDPMTFALHWRTRGVNVSSGGLIRAWAGLARSRDERPCLPP